MLLSSQDNTEKQDPELQLAEAFTNPEPISLTAALKYLHQTVHQVKGDGSCLYHAVAHQAKLITTFSTRNKLFPERTLAVGLRQSWWKICP